MKKMIRIILICVLSVALIGCAKEEPMENQWEISVLCVVDPAPDAYVISYDGGNTVSSETGILTLQNQNDFDIVVHLSCNGQEEQVFEIQPGGVTVFHQAVKQEEYTVGIHAEEEDGTEIRLMVYDGERAEVY